MAARLTILLTLVATTAVAAATLEGPSSAGVGSTVDVKVTGSTNERDFVTIVPKGSREGTYGDYQYVKAAALKLKVPVKPGEYEISACWVPTRPTPRLPADRSASTR